MENTEKPASPDIPATQPRDRWWIRLIRYAKRKIEERTAKKQKEPPVDRAARITAKATVWIAFFTFVSVGVSVFTFLILKGQLREMHDGGIDTHNLAVAAGKQAEAAQESANAAYAELRPWIRITDIELRDGKGQIKTLMFHWPLTEKPVPPMLQVKVPVFNVGHSVAQDVEVFSELFFGKFISDRWHDVVTQEERRFCESIADRKPSGAAAIVFPSDSKNWYMGVGGLAQQPDSNPASALILCVNYRGIPERRFQTQAWFGLYEDKSVFINTEVDVDATRLRLIRDESGDHAY